MSRVVVIGAGLGGLAAAARTAAAGHDVTVLEQAQDVGGKLGRLEADGFVFDTGPSLVTMPHLLHEVFDDTGGPPAEGLGLRRLDVACRYTFSAGPGPAGPAGTVLDMPGDPALVPDALDAALGAGTGAQWAAFLERAERIWDVTHEPFLESPVTARGLVSMSRDLRAVAAVAPWRSLRSLGRQYLRDPHLRMLLDRYATYTGSDPRKAPAAHATVPWVEQTYGSWYVDGGLHRLARTVRDRAVERGARVRLGERVEEVLVEGGRAAGVRLEGGEVVAADVVVANADAAQLYGRLLHDRRAHTVARRLARTPPSLAGFVLLLALDHVPPGSAHHRVLFAEDYEAEFDAVFGRRGPARPVPAPTVYVSAPDDPTLVPVPGAGAWFVLVNAPPHDPGRGTDWDTPGLADRYAEHVLDLMAGRGLDVRPHLRHRHVLTPADLARSTLTPGGSIYGTASNGARAAFLRPANRSPVPGLLLVGGSSHPGGGLPLVTLSARIVAGLVGPA